MASKSWLTIASLVLVLLALPKQVQSRSVFNFRFFNGREADLIYQGDAHIANHTPNASPVPPGQTFIRLTATNPTGPIWLPVPLQNRTGRVLYAPPIRLWDPAARQQATFQTNIKGFIGKPNRDPLFGDGIAFFIAPVNSTIPPGSHEGNLGIYDSSGASPVPIFAVELDVYYNIWEPDFRHVGINVNSRTSVNVARWDRVSSSMRDVEATIGYDARARLLTVVAIFRNSDRPDVPPTITKVEHALDLKTVLPEWVQIGISASTGQWVTALHDIHQWSFVSNMVPDDFTQNYIRQDHVM